MAAHANITYVRFFPSGALCHAENIVVFSPKVSGK